MHDALGIPYKEVHREQLIHSYVQIIVYVYIYTQFREVTVMVISWDDQAEINCFLFEHISILQF